MAIGKVRSRFFQKRGFACHTEGQRYCASPPAAEGVVLAAGIREQSGLDWRNAAWQRCLAGGLQASRGGADTGVIGRQPPWNTREMHIQQLAEIALQEACQALLPAVQPQGNAVEPLCIAAVIGFAGDDLRGTFGVAANPGGLQRVHQHLGGGNGTAEDALGEMANLLIGNLKRSFTRYGQLITISPPLVIRGINIEICGQRPTRAEFTSEAPGDRVTVWVDCDAAGELVVQEVAGSGDVVAEGEALLF